MDLRVLRVYRGMLNRCYNKNVQSYINYGGRGIYVDDRWRGKDGFKNFLTDMGERPPGHTIERLDNNGPYGPSNCKWASREEQASNKRNNRHITANGQTHTLAGWARILGCTGGAIWARLNNGMDPVEAVTKPIPERANAKLGKNDVLYIRENYPAMTAQKIATHLGVSKKTILNVLHGKTFRDI